MSVILEVWDRLWGFVKRLILQGENIARLTELSKDCSTNIDLQKGFIESLNRNVLKLDQYGSKGMRRKFKEVFSRMDDFDKKLAAHGERISALEGAIRSNGHCSNKKGK